MAQIVHDLAPGARASRLRPRARRDARFRAEHPRPGDRQQRRDRRRRHLLRPSRSSRTGRSRSRWTTWSATVSAYVSHGGEHQHHLGWQERHLVGGAGVPADRLRCAGRRHGLHGLQPRRRRTIPATGSAVPTGRTLRVALQWAQPWNGVTTDLDMPSRRLDEHHRGLQHERKRDHREASFEFIGVTNNTGSAASRCGCSSSASRRRRRQHGHPAAQDDDLRERRRRTCSRPSTRPRRVATSSARRSSATTAPRTRSEPAAVPFNNSATVEAVLVSRAGHALLRPGRELDAGAPARDGDGRSRSPTWSRPTAGRTTFFGSERRAACSGSSGPPPRRRTPRRSRHSSATAIATATPAQIKTAIKSTARTVAAFPAQADRQPAWSTPRPRSSARLPARRSRTRARSSSATRRRGTSMFTVNAQQGERDGDEPALHDLGRYGDGEHRLRQGRPTWSSRSPPARRRRRSRSRSRATRRSSRTRPST